MNPTKNTIGMLGIGYAKKEIMADTRRCSNYSTWIFSVACAECNHWLQHHSLFTRRWEVEFDIDSFREYSIIA